MATDAFERFRQLHGIVPPVSVHTAELLRHEEELPQKFAEGEDVDTPLSPSPAHYPSPAPGHCTDGHHEPYPERPSMLGILQCQHCPYVWRVDPAPPGKVGRSQAPCPACRCTWFWPTTRNTWLCADCVAAGRVEIKGWVSSQPGTPPVAMPA